MKKFITAAAAALITCSAMSVTAFADEASADVYVTLYDETGTLAVTQEAITVTDTDSDGALTINDALIITHDKFYEGGSEAGYKSTVGQYGLGLDKLWGVENGGSYGYYVNNNSAMSLTDTVNDGDYISAFIYPDPSAWATTYYSWFDKNTAEAEQGDEITVTLLRTSFDENFNVVPLPVEGSIISVNGTLTEIRTDADGKAVIKLDNAGKNIISASTVEGMTLITPVLVVDVNGAEPAATTTAPATTTTTTTSTATTTTSKTTTTKSSTSPKTGDTGAAVAFVLLGTGVAAAFSLRKKNND